MGAVILPASRPAEGRRNRWLRTIRGFDTPRYWVAFKRVRLEKRSSPLGLLASASSAASDRRGRDCDARARRRHCRRRRPARGRPCQMRSPRHIRPGLRATPRSRQGCASGNSVTGASPAARLPDAREITVSGSADRRLRIRASRGRRYQPEPPPPPPPSPLPPSPPNEPSLELGGVEAVVIAAARPPPRSELNSETSQRFQGWLPSYQSGCTRSATRPALRQSAGSTPSRRQVQ